MPNSNHAADNCNVASHTGEELKYSIVSAIQIEKHLEKDRVTDSNSFF